MTQRHWRAGRAPGRGTLPCRPATHPGPPPRLPAGRSVGRAAAGAGPGRRRHELLGRLDAEVRRGRPRPPGTKAEEGGRGRSSHHRPREPRARPYLLLRPARPPWRLVLPARRSREPGARAPLRPRLPRRPPASPRGTTNYHNMAAAAADCWGSPPRCITGSWRTGPSRCGGRGRRERGRAAGWLPKQGGSVTSSPAACAQTPRLSRLGGEGPGVGGAVVRRRRKSKSLLATLRLRRLGVN